MTTYGIDNNHIKTPARLYQLLASPEELSKCGSSTNNTNKPSSIITVAIKLDWFQFSLNGIGAQGLDDCDGWDIMARTAI